MDVEHWQEQVEVALELHVKHFDASLDGVAAPRMGPMADFLTEHGVTHNINATAAAALLE
jgi:hypothetical protein